MSKISKVDAAEGYHRLSNPKFKGEVEKLERKTLDSKLGIKGLYSPEKNMIKTYLFDNTAWTKDEAKEWVGEHAVQGKGLKTTATIVRSKEGMLAIASDSSEDRDGEVIDIEGWDLKAFKKNPVLLWLHNRAQGHNGLPIGKAEKIGYKMIDGKKRLVFEPVFDNSTAFNRTVKKMAEELGLLNTFSVGFLPKEMEGNKFTKQMLLEISLVPVPSNSNAEFIQRAKDFGVTREDAIKFVEIKAVVPYRAYVPAAESRGWDSGAAIGGVRGWAGGPDKEEIDFNQYKEAFTWYDVQDEKKFGAYKLPHHEVVGDELVTNWKGVVSAMAALLGARGGVDVPEGDRKGIYNHLAKHYKQFDKVSPEFKLVETQELKDVFEYLDEVSQKEGMKELRKITNKTLAVICKVKKEQVKEKEKLNTIDSKLTKARVIKSLGEYVKGKETSK